MLPLERSYRQSSRLSVGARLLLLLWLPLEPVSLSLQRSAVVIRAAHVVIPASSSLTGEDALFPSSAAFFSFRLSFLLFRFSSEVDAPLLFFLDSER